MVLPYYTLQAFQVYQIDNWQVAAVAFDYYKIIYVM